MSGFLEFQERLVKKRNAPIPEGEETFGSRLARLRKRADYTQQELANEIGVTQRVMSYYEAISKYPPSHLLPALAKALSVTIDELLGLTNTPHIPQKDNRLKRRMNKLEKLSPNKKKQAIRILDAILDEETDKSRKTR